MKPIKQKVILALAIMSMIVCVFVLMKENAENPFLREETAIHEENDRILRDAGLVDWLIAGSSIAVTVILGAVTFAQTKQQIEFDTMDKIPYLAIGGEKEIIKNITKKRWKAMKLALKDRLPWMDNDDLESILKSIKEESFIQTMKEEEIHKEVFAICSSLKILNKEDTEENFLRQGIREKVREFPSEIIDRYFERYNISDFVTTKSSDKEELILVEIDKEGFIKLNLSIKNISDHAISSITMYTCCEGRYQEHIAKRGIHTIRKNISKEDCEISEDEKKTILVNLDSYDRDGISEEEIIYALGNKDIENERNITITRKILRTDEIFKDGKSIPSFKIKLVFKIDSIFNKVYYQETNLILYLHTVNDWAQKYYYSIYKNDSQIFVEEDYIKEQKRRRRFWYKISSRCRKNLKKEYAMKLPSELLIELYRCLEKFLFWFVSILYIIIGIPFKVGRFVYDRFMSIKERVPKYIFCDYTEHVMYDEKINFYWDLKKAIINRMVDSKIKMYLINWYERILY